MTIRPMLPTDLDAVMRLAASTPEAPHWGRAAYEAFLDEHPVQHSDQPPPLRRILVADEADCLVGFIAGQIAVDICELESIAVAPERRRAGVGRVLLASLTEWARDSGASQLQLEVRSGNSIAIAFYKRSKFASDGLRRAYYCDPEEDAVLMSRRIGPRPKP